ELARRSLQASIKPRLVDVPPGKNDWTQVLLERRSNGSVEISVPVRNVGVGLALIQRATMHWDAPDEAVSPTTYGGTVSGIVVPPNEVTVAVFRFWEDPRIDHILATRRFSAAIRYTDSANEQIEITKVHVMLPLDAADTGVRIQWAVLQVSFWHEGET